MVEYAKDWLSVEQQVARLEYHGLEVSDPDHAARVVESIGYYRLTGFLYPFRSSEAYVDEHGRTRVRILSGYRPGTRLSHAEAIIDFDRRLIEMLDHLRDSEHPKQVYGTYNALAVIAYLLASIDPDTDWPVRVAALFRGFPTSEALTIESLGAPTHWDTLDLWRA